ncbi:MAG TPA: PIN domain-containing protein [Candidatus Lokiarchaeia archaeon]|nr:PIN domain-containing protein [Candidatus Lokiarchaeia archaeon]
MSTSHIRHVVDSNILVYSLLKNHPAHQDCASYLESHDFDNTLFSTIDSINELYHAFLIYYQLEPDVVLQNISDILESSITFMHPGVEMRQACSVALQNTLDLNDVALYFLALEIQAPVIVTDDIKFATFIKKEGLICETPIQQPTRDAMTTWESSHLPKKGLPRILAQVYRYLDKTNAEIANKFKIDSATFSKLPVS